MPGVAGMPGMAGVAGVAGMAGPQNMALPSGHLITTNVGGQQQIIQIPPGVTADQLRQHLPGKKPSDLYQISDIYQI